MDRDVQVALVCRYGPSLLEQDQHWVRVNRAIKFFIGERRIQLFPNKLRVQELDYIGNGSCDISCRDNIL